MQAACRSKDCDIFLDEQTHYECANSTPTSFHSRIMVKGKSMPISIYKPIDIYDKIGLQNLNLRATKSKEEAMCLCFDGIEDIPMNTIIPHISENTHEGPISYATNLNQSGIENTGRFDLGEFMKKSRKLPKIYGKHKNALVQMKNSMIEV